MKSNKSRHSNSSRCVLSISISFSWSVSCIFLPFAPSYLYIYIYIFIYTWKHEWDNKIWEEMITSFGSNALSYLSAKINKEKNKQHVTSLVLLTFPKIKKASREVKAVTVQNIF